MRLWMTGLVLGLAACSGGGTTGTRIVQDTDVVDDDGPVCDAEPITDAQPFGQDILVEAHCSDVSGLLTLSLFYRQETSKDFKQKAMESVSGPAADCTDSSVPCLFQGTIKGNDVGSAGMFYYFEAVDDSDLSNMSDLPEEGADEAWHFPVSNF